MTSVGQLSQILETVENKDSKVKFENKSSNIEVKVKNETIITCSNAGEVNNSTTTEVFLASQPSDFGFQAK